MMSHLQTNKHKIQLISVSVYRAVSEVHQWFLNSVMLEASLQLRVFCSSLVE